MSVSVNRRTFVTSCAVSAAGIAVGVPSHVLALDTKSHRWLAALSQGDSGTLRDLRVRALVNRALDTARSAGAQYADVRVTYTRSRRVQGSKDSSEDTIFIGFSIRALVSGYWGRAVTPLLTEDEVVRVGRTAVANAQTLVKHGRDRVVEWAPIPTIQEGDWTTPIEVDPFTVPLRDMTAFMNGEEQYAKLRPGLSWNGSSGLEARFVKQDRVFASTEGSYGIQTRYITTCGAALVSDRGGAAVLPTAGTAQAGWEYVRDQPWRTAIPGLLAEIDEELKLPFDVAVDVGRYDIVFGADAMGSLLASTIGSATSLGRALAYEANTLGTSYLGPHVLSVLGTAVASPLLSVMANRSRSKALATVKWDDEGVTPEDFPLITEGVLVDYQTTREQAPWLKEWYAKQGIAVRSRGCAASRDAHAVMRENTPNLEMRPGSTERSFDNLIAELGTGVAIRTLGLPRMDWQCLNGLAIPTQWYTIRGGKRVARINHNDFGNGPSRNALMFRAPEFLKGLMAIGGPQSLQWKNVTGDADHSYTIGSVPAVVKQMTIIDPSRRA